MREHRAPADDAAMQGEVCRRSHSITRQNGLELTPRFQPLHGKANEADLLGARLLGLDCQPLAALGTPGIDHCTTATGFHANQEAMGTGTANFGGLISAFHGNPRDLTRVIRSALNYRRFSASRKTWTSSGPRLRFPCSRPDPKNITQILYPQGRTALWINS